MNANLIADRRKASGHERPLRFELKFKSILTLVLSVGAIWLLIKIWPILLVLMVALLVAGTLSPAVRRLETYGVKRGLGIAIVFSIFFVLAILFAILTIPTLLTQGSALLDREPELRVRLADYLAEFHLSTPLSTWLRGLKPDALMNAISDTVLNYSLRAFSVIAYSLSALFLGLYVMIDRDRLRGSFFSVVPRTRHVQLSRIIMNSETIVGAYIRGQVITCLLIGIFAYGLLKACNVDNALALAAIAGLADVLPYIGPLISIGPMAIASLSRGPMIFAIVVILMLIYEEFESRVLVPRIYGRALRLPSSVVLFSLLVGGTLMGILGALLALPVAAMIVMLIEELRVELPGESVQLVDQRLREADDRGDQEYERRSAGVDAEHSAAIAVEISRDRREEEKHPDDANSSEITEQTVVEPKPSITPTVT